MSLDFESEYGVNAGYVQSLFEEWKQDASRVDPSWRTLFERAESGQRVEASPAEPARATAMATAIATAPAPPKPERASSPAAERDPSLEPLTGLAARIAVNMTESLET